MDTLTRTVDDLKTHGFTENTVAESSDDLKPREFFKAEQAYGVLLAVKDDNGGVVGMNFTAGVGLLSSVFAGGQFLKFVR